MKTGLRPVSLQSCEEWRLICKWRHVLLPERHQRGGFHESLATFQNTHNERYFHSRHPLHGTFSLITTLVMAMVMVRLLVMSAK
jgi:hypothetical protein